MTWSRDRTQEFSKAVLAFKSSDVALQQQQMTSLSGNKSNSRVFSQMSQNICADLCNTYAKLEKLTLLARRNTLFDDKPMDIEELTSIIKQDISMLNQSINELQALSSNSSSGPGSSRIQSSLKGQTKSHVNNMALLLQSKLAKVTSSFKDVLKLRSKKLRESQQRRSIFSETSSMPAAAASASTSSSVTTKRVPFLTLSDDYQSNSGQSTMGGGDNSSQRTAATSPSSLQQQLQQARYKQDEYLVERADTMANIESTIVELGGIFSQLAEMVDQQDETILRIDSNVQDTALNVESGHSELLRYFQSISGNRWLMIKVFALLMFFFLLFIVFAV